MEKEIYVITRGSIVYNQYSNIVKDGGAFDIGTYLFTTNEELKDFLKNEIEEELDGYAFTYDIHEFLNDCEEQDELKRDLKAFEGCCSLDFKKFAEDFSIINIFKEDCNSTEVMKIELDIVIDTIEFEEERSRDWGKREDV